MILSTANAIRPFIPLIATVTEEISETFQIYKDVEYNKKICNSLMDRVEMADLAIRILKRRKQENETNFRNQEYYRVFLRFVDVMKEIRSFILDVSQIQGYLKYDKGSVKDKFNSITMKFEEVMVDLNFTMTVANEEQRRLDQESLNEDIEQMQHVFKKFIFT